MVEIVLIGVGAFALVVCLIFKYLPDGPAPGRQPDGSFVIQTAFCAIRLEHPEAFLIRYEEERDRIRAEHAGRKMFEHGAGI